MSSTTSSASGSRRSMAAGASGDDAVCAAQARDWRMEGRRFFEAGADTVDMRLLLKVMNQLTARTSTAGGGSATNARIRFASSIGLAPKKRLNSRLNCDALS